MRLFAVAFGLLFLAGCFPVSDQQIQNSIAWQNAVNGMYHQPQPVSCFPTVNGGVSCF